MAAHNNGQAIIFLPCVFLYLLPSSSLIFFSSPNLSGRRLDVNHTFTHWCGPSANLECRSEMCCARLAKIAKLEQKPNTNAVRHCCLTSFSRYEPYLQRCSPTMLCDGAQIAMFGDFFASCIFTASRVQQVSNLHLKFALRPHHVWKYGRHPICDG